MIADIFTGAIRSGTSVLYTTLGELIGQRSGIINLGVDGAMLAGALSAFAVTSATGSPWLGALAGALGGALISLIHAYLVINRQANQLATGLAVMFFGMGITAFLGRTYVDKQIHGFDKVPIPFLSDLPFIGKVLFRHDPLTYLAFLAVPLIWFFLYRTRWGVILRATGERDDVVYTYGLNPEWIRYGAVVFGGFMAGIGGAQLSLSYTYVWVENMVAGRGIVAVALVMCAAWRPARAMLGAYLFGAAESLQLVLQQTGVKVSPFILLMMPYLLTLFVLFLVERKQQSQAPQGLSKVGAGGAYTGRVT